MAKVLLFVIEDNAGPGIRALGSQLKSKGHQPILVFIQPFGKPRSLTALPPDLDLDSANVIDFVGFKMFSFLMQPQKLEDLPASFLTFCGDEQPDIIGFSTRFMEKRYEGFFSALRKSAPNALLIAGGHGPSVHTDAFLDMGLDCVIRGEGEDALVELAHAIEENKSYHNIANLARREQGKTVINPIRPIISNLDAYPLPLRQTNDIYHIMDDTLYNCDIKYTKNAFTSLVLAGRGCMGSCAYCAAPLWRKIYQDENLPAPKHRRRSNKGVIAEVQKMKRDGASSILFMDDYFIRPYAEMLDFFDQWKEKIRLPFFIHFSLEQLVHHPDLLPAAIDAGLTMMDLALQTGDENFASDIFHRKNNNTALLQVFQTSFENYLPIMAEFIDGYTIEGRDDLDSKLEFIRQMPFDPAFYYGSSISSLKLCIHDGSPLSHTWPKLNGKLLSVSELIYRSMLMHFRLIMEDDEFSLLLENTSLKHKPHTMLADFHALLKKKQAAYLRDGIERVAGKEVYFLGCKEVYHANKKLFSQCKPQAILVDQPTDQRIVDGLRVLSLNEALASPERLPIVIFSAYAQHAARKIKRLRPDYPREEIIACERCIFD